MAQVWIYSLVSVLLISLASLLGVFTLSLDKRKLKRIILYLVSFAVGALFGDAFIHLIPESFHEMGHGLGTSLCILGGILLFFLLEKFLRWRHCHVLDDDEDHVHPMVTMNLVGDFVHNLIDGMIIGISYAVSIPIGITTTIAVLLHEIPQEIGDFGVMVHGGFSVRKALGWNLIIALASVLGVIIALTVGVVVENFSIFMLPITAGGFIYIAGSDLIPELHHEVQARKSAKQLLLIVAGVAVMALLTLFETGH